MSLPHRSHIHWMTITHKTVPQITEHIPCCSSKKVETLRPECIGLQTRLNTGQDKAHLL